MDVRRLDYVYEGWEGYHRSIVAAVTSLKPEQLDFRAPGNMRSVRELCWHIADGRVDWFLRLGAPGSEKLKTEMDSRPGPSTEAAPLVQWLERTWQMVAATLSQWTVEDLLANHVPRHPPRWSVKRTARHAGHRAAGTHAAWRPSYGTAGGIIRTYVLGGIVINEVRTVTEGKEKLISMMLIGGGAAFVFGLFLYFLTLVFTSILLFGLAGLMVVGGILSAGLALYIGFAHNRDASSGGPAEPQEEGRIQARFAINQLGEMIFDNYDYDAEEARYYVRVLYLDGRRDEYECARPVFDQCGEGMRGLLTLQGKWLSMFTPLPDSDETRDAYRGI
jgi:uncharacterized damage-inducible protein DinB